MNEALITNWNNVVKPNDTVFHLGDFAFGGSYIWNNVLSRLNGNIHLILGNHDEKNIREGYMAKFKYVGYQLRLIIENRVVYLNHYPFLCYGGTYRGNNYAIQLFGHVHSYENGTGLDMERLQYLFPYQYDVGVDNNNFTPISWAQVKDIINKQVEKYGKDKLRTT